MSKTRDRNDIPVTLFPHSHLSEKALRPILSSFGPVTVYQPWYMEPPPFALEEDFEDVVKVMNPPLGLKPGEGFKRLLSEYKNWIKQHQDKSKAAFLKASQEMGPVEESSWEIRKALRKKGPAFGRNSSSGAVLTSQQKQEESPAMKWHIILHLARDIEDDRREADNLLEELKDKGSPLLGLLGEEDTKNPLMDLNPFESDPQTALYPMDLILEAWFSLFGGYLKGDELLLTLSRQAMDYVSKTWDAEVREVGGDISPETGRVSPWEPSIGAHKIPHRYFSPISSQSSHEKSKLLKHLSGKTLILMA